MRLDKTKPYGTVYGATENGARYVQNGVEFDGEGKPCHDQQSVIQAISDQKQREAERAIREAEEALAAAKAAAGGKEHADRTGNPDDVEEIAYEDMSAADLKVLVRDLGGLYTNKEDAVAWLEQQDYLEPAE